VNTKKNRNKEGSFSEMLNNADNVLSE